MLIFDVQLVRLTEDDIELVRQWRNDDRIRKYMEYRDEITPEMQKKWFASINNDRNDYSLILYKGKKIGLSNIKNIDWDERCGEVGIFIYEEELQNSLIPYAVSLTGLDYVFYQLQLNYVTAHILRTNRRAIRYNKSLGFKLQPGQDHVENQLYMLTKSDYEKHREPLRAVLCKTYELARK